MANCFRIGVLLTLMMHCFSLAAQSPLLDSLFHVMDDPPRDESGILQAYDAIYSIELDQPALAYQLYQEVIGLSNQVGYALGEGKGTSYQGQIHFSAGAWDKARAKFFEAMTLVDTLQEVRFKAVMYNNIGNSYNIEGDFLTALGFLQQANLGFQEAQDTLSQVISSSNISAILIRSGNYQASIGVANEVLSLALSLGIPGVLGDLHLNIGNAHQFLSSYPEAIENFRKAYQYYQVSEQEAQTLNVLGALAQTFALTQQADSLKKYAELGNALVNPQKFPRESSQMYSQQSLSASFQKAYVLSEELARKSLDLGSELKDPLLRKNALNAMLTSLEGQGKYQEALLTFHRVQNLSDSLSVVEKNKQLLSLRTQFETEQKEKEIALLQKQKALDDLELARRRSINLASFGTIGIILLAGFFITRTYRQGQRIALQERKIEEQKVKELVEQQKLVALNATFKGQEAERIRIAKDLHDGLGGSLAAIKMRLASWDDQPEPLAFLQQTTEMVDTAYGEVRQIAHNMSPYTLNRLGLVKAIEQLCEQVRASGTLQVNFQALRIRDKLPDLKESMVYRVVQELINNVLKHAQASILQVQLAQHSDTLELTVEDDGKGFFPDQQSEGIGMQSIRSRVEALEGELDLVSEKNEGTSIMISIPI
ncbi:MAG: sensor histidine kinase [Bacteroidota bacterium]